MADHLRARFHYPEYPTMGSYFNGHYVPTMAEMAAYQASHIDQWEKSVKYGYYGIYFFVVVISVAAFARVYFSWERRRRCVNHLSSDRPPAEKIKVLQARLAILQCHFYAMS